MIDRDELARLICAHRLGEEPTEWGADGGEGDYALADFLIEREGSWRL